MSTAFTGQALPLDPDGLAQVTEHLGVKAPELWAVLGVETGGCGFLPDRRPVILFERHIFSRATAHRYDDAYPDISRRTPGGYGERGAWQYQRLERACALDRKAALESASWGIGQVMGFNARLAGYDDGEKMVAEMIASENRQLLAMARLITENRLDRALRAHDWAGFARGYNGPDYARNQYDSRLAAAHCKYPQGPLPDLALRAAQIYLTYLGFHPGPVDGVMGRYTRAALREFQEERGLPEGDAVDDVVLAALRAEVDKLA